MCASGEPSIGVNCPCCRATCGCSAALKYADFGIRSLQWHALGGARGDVGNPSTDHAAGGPRGLPRNLRAPGP